MKMRKMLTGVLLFLAVFSLAGVCFCESGESENPLKGFCTLGTLPEGFDTSRSYRIMIAGSDSGTDFGRTFEAGAVFAAEEILENTGIDIRIDYNGPAISVDPVEISAICEQAASQNYDALLANAEAYTSLEPTWKSVAEKGLAIVGWWDFNPDLEHTSCIGFVSPDHISQAKLAVNYIVEYFRENRNGTPKVMIMSQGNAEKEIKLKNAAQEACDELGVEMGFVVVGTDIAAQMENISNAFQADPGYNCWIGFTSEAPISCAAVMRETGVLSDMAILGIDTNRAHNDAVRDGRLAGILEQGLYSCGYKSVYMAMDYLIHGELTRFERVEYNKYEIVTEDKLDSWDRIADQVEAFVDRRLGN